MCDGKMSWKGDSHSFREWENAWLCLALKEGGDRALSNSAYTDVPIDTAPPYKSYFLTSCFLFIALILYTWNIQESEQSRSLPGLKNSHGTHTEVLVFFLADSGVVQTLGTCIGWIVATKQVLSHGKSYGAIHSKNTRMRPYGPQGQMTQGTDGGFMASF